MQRDAEQRAKNAVRALFERERDAARGDRGRGVLREQPVEQGRVDLVDARLRGQLHGAYILDGARNVHIVADSLYEVRVPAARSARAGRCGCQVAGRRGAIDEGPARVAPDRYL